MIVASCRCPPTAARAVRVAPVRALQVIEANASIARVDEEAVAHVDAAVVDRAALAAVRAEE